MTPFRYSAIIPAYDAEVFVSDTLRSTTTQTIPPSEAIVIDDGPTDGAGRIVSQYGGKVHRLQKENGGQGLARKIGIEQAR